MRRSVLAGLAAAILASILVIYFTPSIDDFDPGNPGWNGLSELSSILQVKPLKSLSAIALEEDPSDALIIIAGPEKNFTAEEASAIEQFIRAGGYLILADDFGSGNSLLGLLEVGARFDGSLLLDPLFKYRSSKLPEVHRFSDEFTRYNLSSLVLDYATSIDGCGEPVALSSSYSFLDENLNGARDVGEPEGPLAVACEIRLGRGRIFLISDPSMMVNSMLNRGSNLEFLKILADNRTVYLDESHWKPSSLEEAKTLIGSAAAYLHAPEIRYSLLGLILLMIVRYRRGGAAGESEVEKVLMRNPTWDRELLARLEREMRGEQ